jgi:putative membrane protein
MKLEWISFIFFGIAAALHILFFILESYLFQKPGGYKIFKMSASDHEATKNWALNQGFYNLFLALGMIVGLYFVLIGRREAAGLLVGFTGLSMIGAGLVLFFSNKKLRRASFVQMIPPMAGFLFLIFHIFHI